MKSFWLNLLHLETLFYIGLFIMIVYLFYNNKRINIPTSFREGKVFRVKPSLIQKKGKKLYKHEEKCRDIFQHIFGVEFKSVRPKWLRNPVTGKNLELDGYNEELKLAFEYDGRQHSRYDKHFHKNGINEFIYQRKKDNWKDLQCREHGVFLVRIPHFIDYYDLERYIREKLTKYKKVSNIYN
jgi:hypothetical protein